MPTRSVETLAKELEQDLLVLYGSPLLCGEDLQKAMGYRTIDAVRQAIARKTIPVKVFSMKNRRGKYALVKDIAYWLAENAISEEE
jgi:hypothetical protein